MWSLEPFGSHLTMISKKLFFFHEHHSIAVFMSITPDPVSSTNIFWHKWKVFFAIKFSLNHFGIINYC